MMKIIRGSIILQFIYWYILPIIFIYLAIDSLDKIDDLSEFLKRSVIYFLLSFPLTIIHALLGNFIFRGRIKKTLADKIMSCELRRKYGYNYCVECKDSYTCSESN